MAANIFAVCVVLVLVVIALTAGKSAWDSRTQGSPAAAPAPAPEPSPAEPSLRAFAPQGLRVGTAVRVKTLNADWSYRKVLAREFNAVTAESEMKWAQLEPSRGEYDWAAADRLVDFAKTNRQSVYGHTLVWHTDLPFWLSRVTSPDELRELLRQHITNVVSRYKGRIWAWDVVNEVLADDGSALRDTIWLRKLGPGYIADAFRWAHEADPQAVLFINDYGAEGRGTKSDMLYQLVTRLRAEGVPVHGVGFQFHIEAAAPPVRMPENLSRFTAAGLKVAVTELDVRIKLPANRQKLEQQARAYRQVLAVCMDQPSCVSFTLWGFTDGHSWIPGYHRGYGAACVYNAEFGPKPAYTALRRLLTESRLAAAGRPRPATASATP
ncbi:endo-1,4-beta-xylanase [Catellatospora sp. NPDC049609]|uniref:endo-1,4-beta-xylanase n=1 Tax=Catellatospora sp. NPDC049609 TaxID=3155505 RepID=UPI0034216467